MSTHDLLRTVWAEGPANAEPSFKASVPGRGLVVVGHLWVFPPALDPLGTPWHMHALRPLSLEPLLSPGSPFGAVTSLRLQLCYLGLTYLILLLSSCLQPRAFSILIPPQSVVLHFSCRKTPLSFTWDSGLALAHGLTHQMLVKYQKALEQELFLPTFIHIHASMPMI